MNRRSLETLDMVIVQFAETRRSNRLIRTIDFSS